MSPRLGSVLLSHTSISTQLLLWFLGISLIPCVVLTSLISLGSTDSLKRTVRQGLLAISDAKTAQIESYIRERRADLRMVSRSSVLSSSIPRLSESRRKEPLDSLAYLTLARQVRSSLGNYVESFGYSNGYVFDTDGTLLLQYKADLNLGSNLLNGPLKDSELAEVFDRVRTLLQTEVSDYQIYPGRSQPAAFIAGPVYSTSGRIIGFVALELENEHVFRVFNDYSGLGKSGEAMVAMRRDNEFIYVAPPRHQCKQPSNIAAGSVTSTRWRCNTPYMASVATARPLTIVANP